MHGGAESACVACAQGRIWGAAHRGAGLAEQVEGGASTLAHLGHAEAAAVAPLALEEVDLARQTPTRSRRAWLQMMTLIAIEIYKICEHIGAAICYIFTGPVPRSDSAPPIDIIVSPFLFVKQPFRTSVEGGSDAPVRSGPPLRCVKCNA